ncbi:hypothetical protein ACFL2H_08365 [Planctomycetota bacterium]
MSLSFCAPGPSTRGNSSRLLALESLENRRLLANTGLSSSGSSFSSLFIGSAGAAIVATPTVEEPPPISLMPAVPLDDNIGPVVDCPDLDGRFCLPTHSETRPIRRIANLGIFMTDLSEGSQRVFEP